MDYGDNKFLGPPVQEQPGFKQEPPPPSGPDFSRVFSITLKVILALVLISLVVGGIFLVLGGIGKVAETSGGSDYEALSKKIAYETADREHTLIPASEWNKLVVAAAKAHCAVEGMTVQEVERVVGTPAASDKGSVRYERTVSKGCTKFVGDNCAEPTQEVETETLFFSPNGYLLNSFESKRGGKWLDQNCFGEPFYGRYYKPLIDKSLERSTDELKQTERETERLLHSK